MKRSKKMSVLLGILAVVAIATIGVLQYEEKKEEIKNSGDVILAIASEDITGVSWECETNSLAFYKEENWIYDGDDTFPVDGEKVEDLFLAFEEFRASFIIENVEDYSQYGLENPDCTILLETEEESYEIKLGNFSAMDEERYVSIGDGNVYLAMEDPYDDFDAALSDFILADEIPELTEAEVLTFKGKENYTITLEDASLTYHEDDLYYTEQDGETLALDPSNVKSYLKALDGLDLSDYKTYSATWEDVEKYGLDDPTFTISVTYPKEDEDGETPLTDFVIDVKLDPEDADIEDEDEDFTAYVRIEGSSFIYEITSAEYKKLAACSYDDLRHQEIFWADTDLIDSYVITLEGEEYEITSKGKDDNKKYYLEGEEIEIDDLESALTGMEAETFTDAKADGKEEIRLTIRFTEESLSDVELAFYRYDGSQCIVSTDGVVTAFTDRTEVVDLIEAVNGIVLN